MFKKIFSYYTITIVISRNSDRKVQLSVPPPFSPQQKGNCRRPIIHHTTQLFEKFEKAPHELRSTIRDTAAVAGCSYSTLRRKTIGKDKVICCVNLSVRPLLSDWHKEDRVRFCWSKIDYASGEEGRKLVYGTQFNTIHIDKKWFYCHKSIGRYI